MRINSEDVMGYAFAALMLSLAIFVLTCSGIYLFGTLLGW